MTIRPSRQKNSSGDPSLQRLLAAIVKDDRAAVSKLLEAHPSLSGAVVDQATLYGSPIVHWLYAGDSALHLAAAGHRSEITRLLLSAGADSNLARNHRRGRPLHYAADGAVRSPNFDSSLQVETIRSLLNGGAEVDAADKNGATALHRAVRTRSAAAVEFLLIAGANPAAQNHSGATPFHLAVQNTGKSGSGEAAAKAAQRRIIELMLARNVSVAMRDAQGKSVQDWARSTWIQELLIAG